MDHFVTKICTHKFGGALYCHCVNKGPTTISYIKNASTKKKRKNLILPISRTDYSKIWVNNRCRSSGGKLHNVGESYFEMPLESSWLHVKMHTEGAYVTPPPPKTVLQVLCHLT